MLGRLEMTVEECIGQYISLSDKVFERKSHLVSAKGNLKGRFDTAALEQAVKQMLLDRSLNEDMLLKGSPDAVCKVYVANFDLIATANQKIALYARQAN